jgi:hypothetical protein
VDEALCKDLNRVVTGEELYVIENIESLSFSCDVCGIPLNPCSYKKEVNLRRPYFKAFPGKNHLKDCDAKGVQKIRDKGRKKRITDESGFPLPYPSRFLMRREDAVEPTHEPAIPASPNTQKPRNVQEQQEKDQKRHNNITTSFRAIVNQFFDFPYDRDLPVQFEGINGDTYSEIFQKIESTIGKQQFRIQGEARKIYYSPISWEQAKENGDLFDVPLSRGRWADGRNERPYYVRIDFSTWPKQSRTKFVNLYNKVLAATKGTNQKAVIAFVGCQDISDDYFRFYSEHRFLVCFKLFHDAV